MQESGSGVEPLAGEGKAAEDEDEDEASDEESVLVEVDVDSDVEGPSIDNWVDRINQENSWCTGFNTLLIWPSVLRKTKLKYKKLTWTKSSKTCSHSSSSSSLPHPRWRGVCDHHRVTEKVLAFNDGSNLDWIGYFFCSNKGHQHRAESSPRVIVQRVVSSQHVAGAIIRKIRINGERVSVNSLTGNHAELKANPAYI